MTEENKTNKKEQAAAVTAERVQQLKKMLTLEPIFINLFARKLKPFAKAIYFIFSAILALAFLGTLLSIGSVGFSGFILFTAVLAVDFIVVRMFAEYLNQG